MKMQSALRFALILLANSAAASDMGTAFTYQGRLTDGGQPANGSYDLRLTLYADASSGNAVAGPLTNAAVAVSNGLFTVALDFGEGVFTGEARWVEMGVRSNGVAADFTVLEPRQPLTPTPYALHAASLNATGITGTIAPGNIGVGSITAVMLAAGSVGSNQLAPDAVTTAALAEGAVTAAKVATVSNWFALTIANPSPGGDSFGCSVAAVGTDAVLIGAPYDDTGTEDAGAAYLFSTNGAVLATFTDPSPASWDGFGSSVAALGTDGVLIGTPYDDADGLFVVGAAYLFSTNGTLVMTFTNPTPALMDYFGTAMAAVGTDRVLIGAEGDGAGADFSGVAYLFSTNGALLTTFTNPTPATWDGFGSSLAAVGTDRVLIGAFSDDTGADSSGAAYLFSTNGALLTTFTNPTPAASDYFGWSVAAAGADRVLIGAEGDAAGGDFSGVAYMFSTNGALLTTFTNPTPATWDSFGYSVAAVGTDRVLIGAHGDSTGAPYAGAAYLFRTNGALLTAFTNPTPMWGDGFGYRVAAVGTDRVLIGAPNDDMGAPDAGAVYLFSIESYTPGLVTDGVNARSISTTSLEDGAVTLAKLDSAIGVWTRVRDDVFRLAGNVGIGTSSFTSNRLEVAGMVGATAFNTTSDRAAKQDFTAVDTERVLARVATLPITQWRFQEYPGALHLGPVAQDFHAAFGLGDSDNTIATVDADGVALAAIQGLNQKLEVEKAALHSELHAKDAELQALKASVAELQEAVRRITQTSK